MSANIFSLYCEAILAVPLSFVIDGHRLNNVRTADDTVLLSFITAELDNKICFRVPRILCPIILSGRNEITRYVQKANNDDQMMRIYDNAD